MKKKKRSGFTLVELLAVVVILGVTFMFVLPKMVGLISDSEDKEIELIEERVLSAAKDYVNHIDGSFYTKLYKEGDINYIYKTDLIKAGLIEEEEINKLDALGGVKGELLSNDKIKYTVEYINASPSEYTNEELYLMYQNMNDRLNNLGNTGGSGSGGNIDSSAIDDLQSQINENSTAISNINTTVENNTTEINTLKDKNSFLDSYPIGSVYISDTNTNPGTIYGGTWTLIDKRFKPYRFFASASENAEFFTPNSSVTNEWGLAGERNGNELRLRLTFSPIVELNDTTKEIGTININALGVSGLSLSYTVTCPSDGGNGIAFVFIEHTTGGVEVRDVVTKASGGTIPANGSSVNCDVTYSLNKNYMLDSAVGEFHFKRTA